MAQPSSTQLDITVLSLNAWDLWLVSRKRRERMAALANFLRSSACTADVVLLQEVWVEADVQLLSQAAAEGGRLTHSCHYSGGAIGSGLLVLSAFPIVEVAFHPFSARGDPAAVLCGDFFAGKGVGWAALQTPLGRLSVFNTHLSANYQQLWQWGAPGLPPECRLPRDAFAGVRLLQMLELAAFVAARGQGSAAGVVVGGDLNAAPDTLEMAVLRALLQHLCDAWEVAQPLRLGATANALDSTFTTVGGGHGPARIDYLLTTARPVSAELALADTGLGFSYSDHLGVTAVLRIGGGAGESAGQSGSGDSVQQQDGEGGGDGHGQARGRPARRTASRRRSRRDDGEQNCWQHEEQQQTEQRQEAGSGTQSWAGQPLPPAAELMQRRPAAFQHAASAIEQAAREMWQGQRRWVRMAAGLWAAGIGCVGALAARPWWQQGGVEAAGGTYLALVGGVAATFGWAGVLLVGGFVGRGTEARALQQAAAGLRRAVGACKAFA